MKISKEDVSKVAQIAHLKLTEDELEIFAKDLEKMAGFANELDKIDTKDIELDDKKPDLYNVLRKDEVQPSMPKEDLLANAPEEKEGCFFVPQIVE